MSKSIMPQNNASNKNSQLDANTLKAHMGTATFLMSHLLGQPKGPESANPAPEPPSNQQNGTDVNSQISALEGRVMDEMSQLKDEIRKVGEPKDQNQEILDLKNQIEAILNES